MAAIDSVTENTIVAGTAGNDVITNVASNVTINAGGGDDTITNTSDNVLINCDDGKNIVNSNYGERVTINGANNGDNISIYGGNAIVYGGTGNDTIISKPRRETTISGGRGNDYFSANDRTTILYANGDGNDTIYGEYRYDGAKIKITSGSYSLEQDNDDVVIKVGDGSITAQRARSININGTDYYANIADGTFFTLPSESDEKATDGDDCLTEYGGSLVLGGKGNDTLYSYGTGAVTLSGGEGDDLIYSGGGVLLGGDGNDTIFVDGVSDNVTGGTGDDAIVFFKQYGTAARSTFNYEGGDGYDTIYGYDGEQINVTSYDNLSTVASGNDLIVAVDGGSITIVDAKGKTINLNDSRIVYDGLSSTTTTSTTTGGGVYVSKTTGGIVNGTDSNDTIIVTTGDTTINAGKGDDYIDNRGMNFDNVYLYAEGDGNDTIVNCIYSTLKVTSGSYAIEQNGDDKIVHVGEGSVLFKNRPGSLLNIKVESGSSSSTITTDSKITETTVLQPTNNTYTYSGGNGTIANYQEGDQINLASDFTGTRLDGNNFYVNSSSGSLKIENVRGKVVSYGDAAGNLLAHSYVASGGGTIDRREATAFEVIIGADNADNEIYVGRGGSSMWGGVGGNDTLIGGEFYDEFIYNSGGGQDVILNASDNDVVNLSGVDFNQFVSVEVNESAVSATFADGGSLRVGGNSGVGYKLGDVIFTVNQATNTWSIK